MSIEGPVVSFIVNQLGNLLIEEGRMLVGVKDEVELLQLELSRMQSLLESIGEIRGDGMSKYWNVEVRDHCYEAEDIIETFVLAKMDGGDIGCPIEMFCRFLKHLYLIHCVGYQLKAIKAKITSFRKSLKVYGIKIAGCEFCSTKRELEWRNTYHHVKEYPVGSDEDSKKVVKQLVMEKVNCRVVSIWGTGGLGKTTLARRVFHHQDVERHFDGRAWACISQQYDRKEILQRILAQLKRDQKDDGGDKKDEVEKMSVYELLEALCNIQRDKKCLVVLDDVWHERDWSVFEAAFPIGENTGSKILVTTRDKDLGKKIYAGCFSYEPRRLDEEESWKLLRSKAFGTTEDGSGPSGNITPSIDPLNYTSFLALMLCLIQFPSLGWKEVHLLPFYTSLHYVWLCLVGWKSEKKRKRSWEEN